MTASIKNNGGSQFDILIGGLVIATIDATGLVGVKDLSITAAKLATNMLPIGVGQTEQDVTGSRSLGVTYTNSTGRTIRVTAITSNAPSITASLSIYRAGRVANSCYHSVGGAQLSMSIFADILNGETYSVTGSNLGAWLEIR